MSGVLLPRSQSPESKAEKVGPARRPQGMLDADLIGMAILIGALWKRAALGQGQRRGLWHGGGRRPPGGLLWSAAYMWLSALWQQRPVLKELARLSLSSVCVYVCGMGVLAFVTVHTFLGVSVACVSNYTVSAGCLCACDLLDRQDFSWAHRTVALFSLTADVMVTLGDAYYLELANSIGAGSWGHEFIFGILLPLLVPVLY